MFDTTELKNYLIKCINELKKEIYINDYLKVDYNYKLSELITEYEYLTIVYNSKNN